MLQFGSSLVKIFILVRGVRGEVDGTHKFRLTCESKPDDEKLGRFRSMSMRANEVTVSCLVHLYFGKGKVRFSRGRMIYRLRMRYKTTNVAEVKVQKVEGNIKALYR